MRVIVGGRQTGRTTALIEMCAEAEKRGEVSYIVCHDHREAYRTAQKAKEMGLTIGFPITYAEFIDQRYAGKQIAGFYFDNAEMFFRFLTTVPIKAIAITKEDGADSAI